MAFCANCGSETPDQAAACPRCGHPAQSPVAGPQRTDGGAIVSLVLGILGIFPFPLVLSIVALILGRRARARIARDPSLDGAGLARAGIVLGWIGIVVGVVTFAAGALVVVTVGSGSELRPVIGGIRSG